MNNINIQNILNKFQTIDLSIVKYIKLMNRLEQKYICSYNLLVLLLNLISDLYFVLVSNDKTIMHYDTLYYDTPELIIFNDHKNKIPHRQKIRIRKYADNNMFLEIKEKTEEHKTNKIRIPIDSYKITDKILWIDNNLIYNSKTLLPQLQTQFDRITLVNKDKTERITIDLNLEYKNIVNNIIKNNENIIIEIKYINNIQSDIINILEKLNINQQGFSKYFIGINETTM